MRLTIIIPAYNEASTIGDVVRKLQTLQLPGIDRDVLVIDDGSTDRTAMIAKAHGAVVLRHLINRGLGGALGTGLQAALRREADVIVTFDADGQHSPDDIERLLQPILNGRADVVIGCRLHHAGDMPVTRRIANRLANLVTRILYGVTTADSQSGLRAFSRKAAGQITITSNNYDVSSEICGEIGRHRLKLIEVPIRPIYTPYSLSKGQGVRVGLTTLLRLFLPRRTR